MTSKEAMVLTLRPDQPFDFSRLGCGLAKRLVGAEAHNGQSKGIHRQFIVLHVLAENIGNAGRPSLTLDLAMIGWIGKDLLKFDTGGVRRLPQVVEDDIFDLDVYERKRRVLDVILDDVLPAFLLDDGTLHIRDSESRASASGLARS